MSDPTDREQLDTDQLRALANSGRGWGKATALRLASDEIDRLRASVAGRDRAIQTQARIDALNEAADAILSWRATTTALTADWLRARAGLETS